MRFDVKGKTKHLRQHVTLVDGADVANDELVSEPELARELPIRRPRMESLEVGTATNNGDGLFAHGSSRDHPSVCFVITQDRFGAFGQHHDVIRDAEKKPLTSLGKAIEQPLGTKEPHLDALFGPEAPHVEDEARAEEKFKLHPMRPGR